MNQELLQQCDDLNKNIKSIIEDFENHTGLTPLISTIEIQHPDSVWETQIKLDIVFKAWKPIKSKNLVTNLM